MFKPLRRDGTIAHNPAADMEEETPAAERRHQPAISVPADLRAALAQFEASRASVSLKLFNRFLALTVVRPSEARLAEWSEFTVAGEWRIPAEHMKGRRGRKLPHIVLLSPEAMEVVEVARAIAPAGAAMCSSGAGAAQAAVPLQPRRTAHAHAGGARCRLPTAIVRRWCRV